MSLLVSVQPKWGDNVRLGYCGFTRHAGDFVSDGIAWFERWDGKYDGVSVTHAFIVSGPDEVIEAQSRGVVRASLSRYFRDPACQVFFRKPKFYTPLLGQGIVNSAAKYLGEKYGFTLIVADAIARSYLGHALGLAGPLAWLMANKKQEICSQLAARALNAQPELRGLGVLAQPSTVITPQMLFNDRFIFEDWT